MILAQVVALVLLGFAPVALIIGIFPGAGHAFFRGWLTKLATAVFIKALYSLVIAIVVAVSAALTGATGSLGFLFVFGLQTIFFWAIFVYRKQITSALVSATTGSAEAARMPRMTVVQKGAHAASRPFTALAGVTLGSASSKQESALSGDSSSETPNPDTGRADTSAKADGASAPVTNGSGRLTRAAARGQRCAVLRRGQAGVDRRGRRRYQGHERPRRGTERSRLRNRFDRRHEPSRWGSTDRIGCGHQWPFRSSRRSRARARGSRVVERS